MAIINSRVLLNAWSRVTNGIQNITASNNALKIIVSEHERIHTGKAWLNKDEYVVPPQSKAYYLFRVESYDTEVYVRNFGFVSDNGPMKLHFRESPSFDVNSLGTPLSFNNLNRNSPNLPGMVLYGNPWVDVDSIGYHLDFVFQPESAPGNQAAGGVAQNAVTEWYVDKSKTYLFELENTSSNSATVESQFFVYRGD